MMLTLTSMFLFQNVTIGADGTWSNSLAEFIRNNDSVLLESGDRVVSFYEQELLPCESLMELCDVLGK